MNLTPCRYMIVMIVILTSFNFEKKLLFKAMSFYKQFQTLIGNRTDGSENRSESLQSLD